MVSGQQEMRPHRFLNRIWRLKSFDRIQVSVLSCKSCPSCPSCPKRFRVSTATTSADQVSDFVGVEGRAEFAAVEDSVEEGFFAILEF